MKHEKIKQVAQQEKTSSLCESQILEIKKRKKKTRTNHTAMYVINNCFTPIESFKGNSFGVIMRGTNRKYR